MQENSVSNYFDFRLFGVFSLKQSDDNWTNRTYQRRDLLNRIYASHEERQYAIDRARDLQSSLESRYPSFVKPMLQSHVTGGFWLVSL